MKMWWQCERNQNYSVCRLNCCKIMFRQGTGHSQMLSHFYFVFHSSATFTCEADRKWRSNHENIFSPICLPGITFCLYIFTSLQLYLVYLFYLSMYIRDISSVRSTNKTNQWLWKDYWRKRCSRTYHPLASVVKCRRQQGRRCSHSRSLDSDCSSCGGE